MEVTKTLDTAVRLYDDGHLVNAAKLLRKERAAAAMADDDDTVIAIDRMVGKMRTSLEGRELAWFDAALDGEAEAPGSSHEEAVDLSPVGIALALAGALAMVIAVFLPRAEASTFAFVRDNTLIQSGDGWIFLGLVLGNVASVFRAYQRRTRTWAPLVIGVIAIGAAIYYGTGDRLRLCSVNTSISTACENASPGIGIYVAGVGGLLAVVGGWQLLTARRLDASSLDDDETDTKTCPECAEMVKAAARVCKHCGYRFQPPVRQPGH